ncbi:MAG: sodium:calcium antiporter, partial [Zetaproteobacteria bacterium]
MLADLLLLLAALVLVFVAAEAFTNAVEHLGERIGVSEGVAGSIFAAVGTAMPETIVPIVAILFGGADPHLNAEIGVGAILGAPFMLGTIAFGVLAIAAGTARGWRAPLRPEGSGLRRDLGFFLALFTLSVITGLIEAAHAWKAVVAIALIFGYFFYLLLTVRASKALVEEGHGVEAENPLYFGRVLGERGWVIGLQLVVALAVLILGARLFVRGVEGLSAWLGISALVVSL